MNIYNSCTVDTGQWRVETVRHQQGHTVLQIHDTSAQAAEVIIGLPSIT